MLSLIILLIIFGSLCSGSHRSGFSILALLSVIGAGVMFVIVGIFKLIGSLLSFIFFPWSWGSWRMHRRMRHWYRHMY